MSAFFQPRDLLVWAGGLAEVVEERHAAVWLKNGAGWDVVVPVAALIEANRDHGGGRVGKTSLLGEAVP